MVSQQDKNDDNANSEKSEADVQEKDDSEKDKVIERQKKVDENYKRLKNNIDKEYEEIYEDESGISDYLPVYKVRLKLFVVPILIALVSSGILAWIVFSLGFSGDAGGDDPSLGLWYGIIFTVVAAISSIFIAYIVKKKGEEALKYLMGFAFFLLTCMLSYFFGDILLIIYSPNQLVYNILSFIYFVFCLILSIYLIRSFFGGKMSKKKRNFYVLFIGILIGSFMNIVFYENSFLIASMLIGISIWDIISVKKGPIKSIMEATGGYDPEFERKLKSGEIEIKDFEFSELEIGIGDIAFYSLLASHSLVAGYFITENLTVAIISMTFACIGIIVGSLLTISALKRNKILPGLPLSIFIGIGLALLSGYVSYLII
ncbi:MAG: hypothetical protein GF364_03970 [Candidatus Lokiarchaeota archaeon]|nr:hypothetical protein [Candidatus Lokiarchaeota archaeon]